MELEALLALGVNKKASDLHLLPGLSPLLRIDGDLIPASKDLSPLTSDEAKRLIYSAMTKEQQEEFEINLVSDLAVSFPNVGNFRVSALHQLNGIAAVFRVIPE